VHLDAYRLENAHQIAALMLDDFLVSPYCLAVEWPERIADWLPAKPGISPSPSSRPEGTG